MTEQRTEIIDYTAAKLSRRLEAHLASAQYETAQTLAALMEGYLEGLWTVEWRAGEPCFNLTEADEAALGRQLELDFPIEASEQDDEDNDELSYFSNDDENVHPDSDNMLEEGPLGEQ